MLLVLTTLPIYLVLIIFGFAASFILIYVYRYQSQFSEKKPMRSRRGGTLKAILETVSDDQKTAFIEKQQKTMEIIAETKKKISDRVSEQGTSIPEEMTKKYLAMDSAQEKAVLKDAEKFLKIYASAEPVTEEQRKQDMEELLKAAETLEKMESETQLVDVEERFSNVGYGLWMDTVSQAIRKIIKDTNIRKHGILQVEKLMSFLPRKFDVKDIRNALQLLKKAKEIVDIVELSSNVLAIAFTSEAAQLTISEKVLLATLSDEFEVTKQKIKNIFNWDDAFLNQAVVKLQALNILTMKGDKLSAEGLFTPKDKAELEQKKAVQQPKSPPAIVVPSAGSQGEPPVATRTPVDMAKIPSIPAVPKVPPVPARQPADGTPAPATATAPAPPVKAPPAVPVPKPVALPPKPAETPQVKAVPSVPLPPIKGLPAVKSPVSAPAKPPVTPPVAGKPAVLPPKAPTQQPAVLPPKAPTQQPAVLPPKAPTQQPAVLPPKVPAPKPFEKPAPPRAPEAPFVPKPAFSWITAAASIPFGVSNNSAAVTCKVKLSPCI